MTAEYIMLLFYCAINFAQYVIVSSSNSYISDAIGESVGVSEIEQFSIFLISILFCVLGFLFYKLIIKNIKTNLLPEKRLEFWLVFGLLLMFTGYYFFDYGRAEFSSTLSFGFIFRLIPTDFLFFLYLSNAQFTKKTILAAIAYVATKVAMGWTGMFLGIFWILFIKTINQKRRSSAYIFKAIIVLICAIIFAPAIYSIKFYLRWGFYEFAYLEAAARLVGRIGFYSNALYLYEHSSNFYQIASISLPNFSYINDAVIAVLPRALLGLTGENMETVFVNLVTGNFSPGITFYLGFLGKSIAYAKMNFFDLPLFIITTLLLILLISYIALNIIGRNARPIIFTIIFQSLLSGSIEELSYTLYAMCIIFLLCKLQLSKKTAQHHHNESYVQVK